MIFKFAKKQFSTSLKIIRDPDQHTLLKNIFLYKYPFTNKIGIIINDRKSKQLCLLDPQDLNQDLYQINNIENKESSQLSHILLTSQNKRSKIISHRLETDSQVKTLNGGIQKKTFINEKVIQSEENIFTIGNLIIKFIPTFGVTDHSYCIAINEVILKQFIIINKIFLETHFQQFKLFLKLDEIDNQSSILFVGQTLQLGNIGPIFNKEYYKIFYDSIQQLQNLPNDTLVFPSNDCALDNLMFIKFLDPKNQYLEKRILDVQNRISQQKLNIPYTLLEEKLMNPFFRCDEQYYKNFTQKQDPFQVFKILKQLQEDFFMSENDKQL